MTLVYRHLIEKPDGTKEIAGQGVRVYTLFCAYEMGESAESMAEDRDLPLPAVFEALAYAYDHPEEMEQHRRADAEAEKYSLSLLRDDLRRMAEETMRKDDRAYEKARRKARAARLGTGLS